MMNSVTGILGIIAAVLATSTPKVEGSTYRGSDHRPVIVELESLRSVTQ